MPSWISFFTDSRYRRETGIKIQYVSCILLAFSIPFNNLILNLSAALLILGWIIEGNFIFKLKNVARHPLWLASVVLFLLYFIGLFYSENTEEGEFVLEKKYSLILLPVLLYPGNFMQQQKQNMDKILFAFLLSCFSVSVICLGNGLYKWIAENDSSKLFYHDLVSVFNLHAVYFALYLSFSMFILLFYYFKNLDSWKLPLKFIAASLMIFFTVIILLLTVRTVLVGFLLLSVLYIGYNFLKHKKSFLSVSVVTAIILATTLIAVWAIPSLSGRFSEIINSKFYFDPVENNANGLTLRIVKWTCSWNGIKENLWAGVGTGDMQDYLQACYKEKNFWGQVYHYNSHNQFLQTGLGLGVFGLLIQLYCFLGAAVVAVKKRNVLLFLFVSLIFFACLTESIFERQQGILFFAFFNYLFLSCVYSEKTVAATVK